MKASLAYVAEATHGLLHGDDRPFDGVSTDTRTLTSGQLFFALSGPNFDGRDYVATARDSGAAGAVVAEFVDDALAQVEVGDTRRALGQLGAAWREQLDTTVVGITGSNGKTTLKEMTASILSQAAPTIATAGNLNNEIGVPLMLTRIEPSHRYAVIEMGANHAGEIAYLTSLARPEVVALTNAAAAHLEGFGSIDGVARAKGEILSDPRRPRCAVLNADDRYFEYWQTLTEDIDVLSFGLDADSADVTALSVEQVPTGSRFVLDMNDTEVDIELSLAGKHNVLNACAAAAIACALGIDAETIRKGLESVKPVAGRLQPLDGVGGSVIFNDSYNANPLSVAAAAGFLASLPGDGLLVLGDMGELGDDAPRLHRETGEAVREAGVTRLLATGGLSRNTVDGFGNGASWYPSVEALIDVLANEIGSNSNVLVKGSRFMRMERVVDALTAEPQRREA